MANGHGRSPSARRYLIAVFGGPIDRRMTLSTGNRITELAVFWTEYQCVLVFFIAANRPFSLGLAHGTLNRLGSHITVMFWCRFISLVENYVTQDRSCPSLLRRTATDEIPRQWFVTLSDKISTDKIFVGQNFSPDEIFDTDPNFRQFCPNICLQNSISTEKFLMDKIFGRTKFSTLTPKIRQFCPTKSCPIR